jgi:hypothetical protein
MPGVGHLVIKGTYTFDRMTNKDERPLAEVSAEATVTLRPAPITKNGAENPDASLMKQMEMRIEEGKMTAKLVYDPAIDFTTDAQAEQSFVISAKLPDGSGRVVSIPMTQKVGMKLIGYDSVK